MELKVTNKLLALCNLGTWKDKGHSPISAIRIFGQEDGTLAVGFTAYSDFEVIQVPEHMNRTYKTYQAAFTAVGAMFDALERGDYLEELRAMSDDELRALSAEK